MSAPAALIGPASSTSMVFRRRPPRKVSGISGKGISPAAAQSWGHKERPAEIEPSFDVQLDVDRGGLPPRPSPLRSRPDQHGRRTKTARIYQCATRRLLKTLSTDQRNVVAAGDRVSSGPVRNSRRQTRASSSASSRVTAPSRRAVRGRQQMLVANIDQMLIVASAAEPRLKPNLIDRMLVGRREGPRAARHLHQQDRPGRAGRP